MSYLISILFKKKKFGQGVFYLIFVDDDIYLNVGKRWCVKRRKSRHERIIIFNENIWKHIRLTWTRLFYVSFFFFNVSCSRVKVEISMTMKEIEINYA